MQISVQIIKGLPTKQIKKFEDRTVYNTAVYTREMTKTASSYPYRSGTLARSEAAAPITGTNCNYGLTAGVDYAKYVWKMNDVNWTNKLTRPQWYYTTFKQSGAVILSSAVVHALKEV